MNKRGKICYIANIQATQAFHITIHSPFYGEIPNRLYLGENLPGTDVSPLLFNISLYLFVYVTLNHLLSAFESKPRLSSPSESEIKQKYRSLFTCLWKKSPISLTNLLNEKLFNWLVACVLRYVDILTSIHLKYIDMLDS